MRRFFVGVALFTLAAVTPLAAWGGDREIAEHIISELKEQQNAGVLQGFTLDLDVSNGRVLLKGQVSTKAQRDAVLAAAEGIEGVSDVVDQITVGAPSADSTAPAKPEPVRVDPVSGVAEVATDKKVASEFSLSKALSQRPAAPRDTLVQPAAATEEAAAVSDAEIKAAVVRTLGAAQQSGELRGFGLEVSSIDGDVMLKGRARTSEQKQIIMEMVRRVPGVRNVIDDIRTESSVAPAANLASAPQSKKQVRHLQPVEVQTVSGRLPGTGNGPVAPAAPLPFGSVRPASTTDVGVGVAPVAPVPAPPVAPVPDPYAQAGYAAGVPVSAAPIPMAYGAPRYDNPYLPNYAWPGYAAYPNYAALTYPQQYSPTAWPYIGPFYPYPQVPLGWRKVSLEWDDGWWFLDFTDK
ncbi:BON domain-containing protein [Candidatus Laterigemmans baculatus]|uniref:BON domain-containing protein n=1 Tax=Candidatus Laterigemmans baculatus TaxID=2770505 RepID=UPI0013DAFB2D|nr:BON domain-containing protein [Candidatus Laterigemmans baculatus]